MNGLSPGRGAQPRLRGWVQWHVLAAHGIRTAVARAFRDAGCGFVAAFAHAAVPPRASMWPTTPRSSEFVGVSQRTRCRCRRVASYSWRHLRNTGKLRRNSISLGVINWARWPNWPSSPRLPTGTADAGRCAGSARACLRESPRRAAVALVTVACTGRSARAHRASCQTHGRLRGL